MHKVAYCYTNTTPTDTLCCRIENRRDFYVFLKSLFLEEDTIKKMGE